MQHPEEGIIHAWLDGALSTDEAAALESHVDSCADCADRVAEARGLIAASSRIVNSLDAVPGGVIPAAPKKRSLWVRASWPTAIAATLVFGVSLYNSIQETPTAVRVMAREKGPLPGLDSVTLAQPERTSAASETPPPPPAIGPAKSEAVGRRSAGNVAAVGSASGAQVAAVDSAAATPPSTRLMQKSAPMIQLAPVAAAPVAPQVANTRADSTRRAGEQKLESVVATSAVGATAGATRPAAARAAAPSALSGARAMDMADRASFEATASFAGCYEMNVSTDILPVRFALVKDSAGPGQFEVRYLDADGRPSERIQDAVWTTEGGRAVVKTVGRGTILTLTRTGAAVAAESPNGPRSGRVSSCR